MPASYRSYKNLPQAGGACTLEEAMNPGIGVDACVERLKRYHYALHRLWKIFNARLTAEPVYELKMGFSHHAYLCAEHTTALRQRVAEMRHPPLGLDKIPDPHLQLFFDEILCAPDTPALLAGVYGKALPALKAGMEQHLRDTNPLADYPSRRLLRFALLEIEEMIAYGAACVEQLADEIPDTDALSRWQEVLGRCLAAAGGLDGTGTPSGETVGPHFSREPFAYTRTPQRDARFPDPHNMGVHAEEFLYDDRFPDNAKTIMMYYKRLREIDVPEMMASILYETEGKPWEFYREMTRQLWDEARHAIMGETGFVRLGVDWPRFVMVNFTWSKSLNEQLTPRERHAVLWFIEQGLMSKTGKRFEWEVGRDSGDPLAMLFQDYDWADEVLHARIGRDWYVNKFDSLAEASAYGNASWNKVVSKWDAWKKEGLTEHRNWWPDLYREVCRLRGCAPDAEALAFDQSYEESRADLKRISASG